MLVRSLPLEWGRGGSSRVKVFGPFRHSAKVKDRTVAPVKINPKKRYQKLCRVLFASKRCILRLTISLTASERRDRWPPHSLVRTYAIYGVKCKFMRRWILQNGGVEVRRSLQSKIHGSDASLVPLNLIGGVACISACKGQNWNLSHFGKLLGPIEALYSTE